VTTSHDPALGGKQWAVFTAHQNVVQARVSVCACDRPGRLYPSRHLRPAAVAEVHAHFVIVAALQPPTRTSGPATGQSPGTLDDRPPAWVSE
jgi:hypothetical protein